MKDVVIVGALRTPIGCFRGALAGHSAVELGSLVVKALIAAAAVIRRWQALSGMIGRKGRAGGRPSLSKKCGA